MVLTPTFSEIQQRIIEREIERFDLRKELREIAADSSSLRRQKEDYVTEFQSLEKAFLDSQKAHFLMTRALFKEKIDTLRSLLEPYNVREKEINARLELIGAESRYFSDLLLKYPPSLQDSADEKMTLLTMLNNLFLDVVEDDEINLSEEERDLLDTVKFYVSDEKFSSKVRAVLGRHTTSAQGAKSLGVR